MPNPAAQNHHVRKVIKVGKSVAVVIPPHVLHHLGVQIGSYLLWDLNIPDFGILSRAPVPPYIAEPELFDGSTVAPK
jgi:hypothetical protein